MEGRIVLLANLAFIYSTDIDAFVLAEANNSLLWRGELADLTKQKKKYCVLCFKVDQRNGPMAFNGLLSCRKR